MADFLDVLIETMEQPKAESQRLAYIAQLKILAQHRPPSCHPFQDRKNSLQFARTISQASVLPFWTSKSEPDVLIIEVGATKGEARWFRAAKSKIPDKPIGRVDLLSDELRVLESIAMGVDFYTLAAGDHDSAMLQFLIELGADYHVPALLKCEKESELAKVLLLPSSFGVWLDGPLARPALLDLELLKGRPIFVRNSPEWEDFVRHDFKDQTIIIFDS